MSESFWAKPAVHGEENEKASERGGRDSESSLGRCLSALASLIREDLGAGSTPSSRSAGAAQGGPSSS